MYCDDHRELLKNCRLHVPLKPEEAENTPSIRETGSK